MDWLDLNGGAFLYGDHNKEKIVKRLLWTVTPLTYNDIGRGADYPNYPVTNINFFDAQKIARCLNARLPTMVEWEWMASGSENRIYPWGDAIWNQALANIAGSELGHALPVGSYPMGSTPEGIMDVAGNVWEWTQSLCAKDGAIIRGGSYKSKELYCKNKFFNAAPKELRSKGIGVRLVRDIF